MIRKALFGLALCTAGVGIAAPAMASDPHHEEIDGCDHGATGKECRPDPSEHGKDCDVHGNHGGVNEDHCETTTTTTGPPGTSSTTTRPGPTTTTTTLEQPTTITTLKPSTTTTLTAEQPSTTTTTSLDWSMATEPQTPIESAGVSECPSVPELCDELPRTGTSKTLLFLGLGLVAGGAGFIAASKFGA